MPADALPVNSRCVTASGRPYRDGVAKVTVRYWAGAKAAAGTAEEQVSAGTLAEVIDSVAAERDDRFARVLAACSFVISEQPVGRRPPEQVSLADGDVVEVLPPFAGGAPAEPAAVIAAGADLPSWRAPMLGGLLGLLLMVGVVVGPALLWPAVIIAQLLLVLSWHRWTAARDPVVGLVVAGCLIGVADVAVGVAEGAASYGPIAVVIGVGFLAAVGQQLARRDGRPDLTLSMAATVSLAALGALGAGWVVNLRLADGEELTLVAASAVTAAAIGRLAPRAAGAVAGPLLAGAVVGALVAAASSAIDGLVGALVGVAVAVPSALAAVTQVRLAGRAEGWPAGAAWPVLVAAPLAYFVLRLAGH